MAFPYLDNPATIPPNTLQELDSLVAKLQAFLSKEHTNTGTHSDITATSVDISDDGPLTLGDIVMENPTSAGYLLLSLLKVALLQLGTVGTGAYGFAPGVAILGALKTWDVQSADVSAGPALIIGDRVKGARVLVIVDSASRYAVRPNVALQPVDLGSNGEPFDTAYVNNAIVKSTLTLDMARSGTATAGGAGVIAAEDFIDVMTPIGARKMALYLP